ncbi:MAG: tetratricopeptide repeat protein [Luteitalea sp.]|nr:tetratricopeptide repeat protein [Luteitalea sp.]
MPARGRPFIVLVLAVLPAVQATAAAQGEPARAKAVYARAVELEANGNHAAALPLLWEAAELAPGEADVQHHLGLALERAGLIEAAIEAYRRAIARRPTFPKATSNLVLALVKTGQAREAVGLARTSLAAAPNDPDRHFILGLAQSEQDLAAAIESFRRALALRPAHGLARYNLALALKRADRLPEAIVALERLLETESRPEAYYTLGVIYWQQGDLERAARTLGAAVAAEPEYADAHYSLGAVLMAQRKWVAAATSLRRAITLRPEEPGAYYTLAQVLRQAGDDAAARTNLTESERLRQRARLQHEASVLTYIGVRQLESGDAMGALEHLRRATQVSADHALAHYHMGRALERLGLLEESRAALARARRLNPDLQHLPDSR